MPRNYEVLQLTDLLYSPFRTLIQSSQVKFTPFAVSAKNPEF